MSKKFLLIGIISIIVLITAGYFIFYNNGSGIHNHNSSDHQLWTCGMHPDIIMDEPGNCPICGMKLVPKQGSNSSNSNSGERKIIYYRSPMDPTITSQYPRKDEMGMDYVPVYNDEAASDGTVKISPTVIQNINVKTEKVVKRKIRNIITTNGVLTTNETEEYIVTTRVNGFVQKLYVNYVGKRINRGDKLMEIYSPELVVAQQELLSAVSYQQSISNSDIQDILKSGDELIKNSVKKLQLLEMPDSDIKKLMNSKDVKTYVTLYAQQTGTVISKNVLEGQKINPGMPLLQITNLNTLWLMADVYEFELSKLSLGTKAEIKFNFKPGVIYNGKVSFIYPTIEPKTRTVKVRIDVKNNGELKPDMLANVTIMGKELDNALVAPENAIIRSGKNDIVIIALGEGRFRPQNVLLGDYSDGYYQVLNGLSEGDQIVTSAQFLIDSESNLRTAVNQFTSDNSKSGSKPKKEVGKEIEKEKPAMEMKDNKNNEPMTSNNKPKEVRKEESIVRTGIIDLKMIDKNKDGKLYQDMMDWNVISDEPGDCPICGMELMEMSIEAVKKNLIDNGFKVK
ncbi:MAG: efflux RND transporter periplasmic adaptor subunit [Melioribacteraceae bacterium]|nr:efflux RND transporter periplasmic adaptor subunit [Melioribacteraceae bacterium]